MEHQQELFSSHLSRNALQRLIKQKALEIASDLGLKFKGTRKWLISFVKRCELLGYINVDIFTDSQNENEEKSISVSTTSPSALVCNLFCSRINKFNELDYKYRYDYLQ